jgi:hypothetical protein
VREEGVDLTEAFSVKACVVAWNARTGTGTQTVTGVVDAAGVPFMGSVLIPIVAYAADGVLTNSGNAACWNIGIDTGTLAGASGSADVAVPILFPSPHYIKVSDAGQSTNRSILDTGAQLFFGGYISRLAKVASWGVGSFTLQYDQNDRTGDTIIGVVLGGADLNIDIHYPLTNATYSTTAAPVGVLCLPVRGGIASSAGAANGTNGAGGVALGIGWDTQAGGRGTATQFVINQGGNTRQQVTTACDIQSGAAAVTAWGASSYTVTGVSGSAGTLHAAFSGSGIKADAGAITQPLVPGNQTITTTIPAPRLVFLLSYGAPADPNQKTDAALTSLGFADRTRQCDFWVGENGTDPDVFGARIVSTNHILRFGTPAGASTTFTSLASFVSMADGGAITINWSAVDGTARQILWFALGDSDTTPVVIPGQACIPALSNGASPTGQACVPGLSNG